MHTLKCSRWTMLPTARASRSYWLSFSGAFMTLVYSPDALREIGVIGGDGFRHRPAQQGQFFSAGRRRYRDFWRGVERKTRVGADVALLVQALKAKAPLGLLPGEHGFARDERRRIAGRRDKLDLGHEHTGGMLLAEQDRVLNNLVHERRAEGAGETTPFRAHEVDIRRAVDLCPTEKEHVNASLAREVEQLTRALRKRVPLAFVKHGYPQRRVFLLMKQRARCWNRRGRADGDVLCAADQAGDDAGEELFAGVQTYSSQ